jgi:hypothetical protein
MAPALTFYGDTTKMAMNFSVTSYELTGDKTWVSSVHVETREHQSSGCTHIHTTSQKSLNKRLPVRKLMTAVFWARKGVLMVEFMQQGTRVTSEVYCKTLKKLHRAITDKN